MSDLAERARTVGEHVVAGYDVRRTEEALSNLHANLRRRRSRRFALGSTLGVLCLLTGTLAALRPWQSSRTPHLTARPEARFVLTDGSVVTPLDPTSHLVARSVSPRLVVLELQAGSAHFDVTPNREREFRVRAGRVNVLVVGTKFTVERREARTMVAVEGGRVRVQWERGEQLLEPGERGSFPPVENASEAASDSKPAIEPEVPAERSRIEPRRTETDWRLLANRGEFTAAYRILRVHGKPALRPKLDDLLLAADVARKAGHAADSVPYLERALAMQAGDPRSAVVAFTLGRVRLADLHDPAGAADAFARARSAAPEGPLAEDALAREVEARARSGDKIRARALAEEYIRTWPSGTRTRAVRHFGGLP